jgi:hypothetical protein
VAVAVGVAVGAPVAVTVAVGAMVGLAVAVAVGVIVGVGVFLCGASPFPPELHPTAANINVAANAATPTVTRHAPSPPTLSNGIPPVGSDGARFLGCLYFVFTAVSIQRSVVRLSVFAMPAPCVGAR